MASDVCPHCGGELRFEDKQTFTGREMREYRCLRCGESVVEDCGVALWQVLHDEAERQRAATPVKRPWWRWWRK